ncbi:MAG: TrkH family potassium uptake protein [Candidatus Methanomethylophilaceae archaeon]
MIGIPMFKRHYISGMFSRWESASVHVLGIVLLGLSASLVPSILYAVVNKEPLAPFIWPMAVGLTLSFFLTLLFKIPNRIKPVSGIFMIGLVWFAAIIFGMIPFILSGMSSVDALFESTSGFTTTGATTMTDIESWPSSILLWRSMMQWIGGIAIIMIFLFVLPMIGFSGRTLFGNEMSGSGSGNFFARMKDAGKQFIVIYLILTAIMIIILMMSGVTLFDSLCMSFSTISCGGFMCKGDSIAGYGTIVKIVLIIFMFLGGSNFYLHFRAMYHKKPLSYIRDEEFRAMFFWLAAMSLLVFFIIYEDDGLFGENILNNFINTAFTVVSAGTTTGFAVVDYVSWPTAAVVLLFLIAAVGGSSASTAGGIKISRLIIIYRYERNGLRKLLHPKGVYDIKYNGSSLDDDTINATIIVTMAFTVTIMIGSIVLMLFGVGLGESVSSVIGCITTFGPAVGTFGPMGSYETMSPFIKVFLSLIMWMGRLEIVTALVLFTPGFWKEMMMTHKKTRSRL